MAQFKNPPSRRAPHEVHVDLVEAKRLVENLEAEYKEVLEAEYWLATVRVLSRQRIQHDGVPFEQALQERRDRLICRFGVYER